MTTVIQVENVSKRFRLRKDKSLKERIVNARRGAAHREDFWALREVNLDLKAGSTVGLIGPNGSGKSTLLKAIGGIIQPTEGWVARRGRLAALLELGAGFHPDLTGRENVFLNASILGIDPQQTRRDFDAIVGFSGIERFIDTQVKFYSSGMYVRLAFSVAVHADPDVLLVDEVLAVGDEAFQLKCLDRIRQFQSEGRSIVLVSHALDQVREICDRAVLLEDGRVKLDGSPTEALRLLRSDFEEMREGEPRPVDTPGELVTITSVGLRDAHGTQAHAIAPGEDLQVEVTLTPTQSSVSDWGVGIQLENQNGLAVYGFNTFLAGLDLGTMAGERRVTFTLPRLPLPNGQYLVTAAVHPRLGAEYHRLARCASFSVAGGSAEAGFVHIDTQIHSGTV